MRTVFSFYLDAAKIALQSIFSHKLRAFLTLIGIIIGVASVVVVGASIDGLNAYVVEKVSKLLGVNHFMIARIASGLIGTTSTGYLTSVHPAKKWGQKQVGASI